MNETRLQLKKNIFNRATFFIEKNSLFAPFGAKLLNNGIIKDVVIDDYSGDEIVRGEALISNLKRNFSQEITSNKITAGAIAYDISANFKNSEGIFEKRDALCLLFSNNGLDWDDEFFPYMIIDNQCVWR